MNHFGQGITPNWRFRLASRGCQEYCTNAARSRNLACLPLLLSKGVSMIFGRKIVLCVCLILTGYLSAEEKFDASKLVGKWTITSGAKFGEKLGEESIKGIIEFSKDKIIIGDGVKAEHEMSYKLDTSKTPAQISMTGLVGPAKDLTSEGIVELSKTGLKLAYAMPGEKRPEKFESAKDSKNFFFELKRNK
jgi:uncharacterized protein (TIGR03067 family)